MLGNVDDEELLCGEVAIGEVESWLSLFPRLKFKLACEVLLEF
jgi:hypothetical protein